MEKLRNISPGEILYEEFLIPLKVSQYKLAQQLNIPQTRISEIIKGRRKITADTALRLSMFFGNSAKFWLGLQNDFDLENEKATKVKEFSQIKQILIGQ
ncbi:MAG: HigA family addiction module antitoxin [Candidatus Kapabacteria bacterium]|nr:HigA family addiction module antitoxin [Candidatus Kapabacteria bacterium]